MQMYDFSYIHKQNVLLINIYTDNTALITFTIPAAPNRIIRLSQLESPPN